MPQQTGHSVLRQRHAFGEHEGLFDVVLRLPTQTSSLDGTVVAIDGGFAAYSDV